MSWRLAVRTLLAFGTCATMAAAHAAYPDHPVKMVINSASGGPLDILARLIGAGATPELHQPIIVEAKPGASGTIGAESVSREKPDGYTLLLALDTLATVNPSIYKKTPFNANTALTPIAFLGSFNQVLVVPKSLGVTDLKGFIALSKKRSLNYASAGIGSPGHLSMEAFRLASGVSVHHIPYKGNAPAVNAIVGSQVDTGFLTVAGVLPYVKDGRLIALAVSGRERNALLPDVPTLAESGVQGLGNFDGSFGYLVYAPAGTPASVIDKWNALLHKILRMPQMTEKLRILDIQPAFGSPRDAQQWVDAKARKWAEVIRATHISVD